jgi:DAACS family dicarboxylate/amino acid:cation (Na+ or H+) symporter
MTRSLIPGLSQHTAILLGLVLGAACGLTVNLVTTEIGPIPGMQWTIENITEPAGQIFLRLLLMTVVPLVFASLAVGVAQLGDLRRLGRIGLRTFAFFVLSMSVAVVIGLTLVNTVQPGKRLPEDTRQHLIETYTKDRDGAAPKPAAFGVQTFVNIVPRNPLQAAVQMDMLGVIFFALLFGIGITMIPAERGQLVLKTLEGIAEIMVFIIGLAMLVAPFGVFALIFSVTARFGFNLMLQLALYMLVVIAGLAIQMFGTLSILVATLARLSPITFFSRVRAVIVTAFSTSSSNATLPTSIKVTEEELGVPPQIAGFVLPLGATMNMNGTALFEGVTVVFLAQIFGVPLTWSDQVIIILLAVLTAIGAAGVPGGSIPLLAMVLYAVGVPPEAIGIILGVDRLLDMCRTTLNVTGDIAAAAYVARAEGYPLLQPPGEKEKAVVVVVPASDRERDEDREYAP